MIDTHNGYVEFALWSGDRGGELKLKPSFRDGVTVREGDLKAQRPKLFHN